MTITLRQRLNILSFAPTAILIITALVVFFGYSRSAMIRGEVDQLEVIASLKQQTLVNWFDERMEEIAYLAMMIANGGEDGEPGAANSIDLNTVREHVPHFIKSHVGFEVVVIADAEGRVLFDSARATEVLPPEANVAGRPYFESALLGKNVIDGSILSRTNDRYLVMVAVPVKNAEGTQGVLFSPLSIKETLTSISHENSRFDGSIYIIDSENRLIMGGDNTLPRGYLFPPDRFPVPIDPISQRTAQYHYQNGSGKWMLAVRLPLEIDDWSIVVEIPQAVALANSHRYLVIIIIVGAIALFIALITGTLIAGSVLRPMGELTELSRLVAQREYHAAVTRTVPEKGPVELQRVVRIFQETVVALNRHMEQLEETTLTDYLTSLPNRRYFERELYRNLKLCRREGWVCTLMMLDLDHFKRINDSYGHPFGDRVLTEFSRRLTQTIRSTDLAARIGGEEFSVLCPNTDTQSAIDIATRILNEVRTTDLHPPGDAATCRLTVSIGVVVVPAEEIREERMDALLDQADRALYQSKKNGRDRLTVSNE